MSHFTSTIHKKAYDATSPTRPELSQAGKTVLITGGGTGIGFAIARAFIKASAAKVIIASRRESVLLRAASELRANAGATAVEAQVLDSANHESIDKYWQTLKDQNIDVDVLVLNAAGFGQHTKLSSPETFEDLKRSFQLNVMGNYHMAVKFLAQGKKNGKVLQNVSTAAAHWNPVQMPVYSTTKASFTHLFQSLSDEIPVDETQMISFHPGAIFTPAASDSGFTEDTLNWDHEDLPAHMSVWAASSEASFLHGRMVWASWDVTELQAMKDKFQDAGFLRLGLLGLGNIHPKDLIG